MSAALALTELSAAGGQLLVDGDDLIVRVRRGTAPAVREAALAAAPALLTLASGRWLHELADWPVELRDLYEERVAIMKVDGLVPEALATWLAFLDVGERADELLAPGLNDLPPCPDLPRPPLAPSERIGLPLALGWSPLACSFCGKKAPPCTACHGANLPCALAERW